MRVGFSCSAIIFSIFLRNRGSSAYRNVQVAGVYILWSAWKSHKVKGIHLDHSTTTTSGRYIQSCYVLALWNISSIRMPFGVTATVMWIPWSFPGFMRARMGSGEFVQANIYVWDNKAMGLVKRFKAFAFRWKDATRSTSCFPISRFKNRFGTCVDHRESNEARHGYRLELESDFDSAAVEKWKEAKLLGIAS